MLIEELKKHRALLLVPVFLAAACAGGRIAAPSGPAAAISPAVPSVPSGMARRYTEGEVMKYRLELDYSGSGEPGSVEISSAVITVNKTPDNVFYESIQWTGKSENGAEVRLSTESLEFRQKVSLDPGFKLAIPDLSQVLPLIEPVVDTLTFYADVQLAVRKGVSPEAGQHLYVAHGMPNSWAGGPVMVGRDCVDFDITVTDVDAVNNWALLQVLHLPPPGGCGVPPAPWMRTPDTETPNNWYQVRKEADGSYTAGAAVETFDDEIKISLTDGRILSASQVNPLSGEKRVCKDAELTDCGQPQKFSINRRLVLSPYTE